MEIGQYHQIVEDLLERISTTQSDVLSSAARIIYQSLVTGGVLHAFSSGHSHMMVEEIFYRAGGLACINPLFDSATMLHQSAIRSTSYERLSGYAQVLLQGVELHPGESLLIISNSGINPLPVEMAVLAKERGLNVIAITSVNISLKSAPRTLSGQKLLDVADVTIDNCIQRNDAAIELPDCGLRVGALSTIAGVYIVQRLVLNIINEYLHCGEKPPVFMSANVPGGDEWNAHLIDRYKSRVKAL